MVGTGVVETSWSAMNIDAEAVQNLWRAQTSKCKTCGANVFGLSKTMVWTKHNFEM
jgi:hypothetical protein